MRDEGTFIGEVQRGWQRFWRLSWWWKGPILGVVGFMVLGGIGAAAGGGNQETDSQVAEPTLVSVSPTPEVLTDTSTPVPTTPAVTPPPVTPTPDPTEPPNRVAATPGAVAEFAHVRVYLNAIQDPWFSDNMFIEPDPGNRFVSFDVTIEYFDDNNTHSANPFNFGLSDVQNFAYDPTFYGPDPQLHSVELHPNEKVRGWVTFEVNATNPLQILRYQPNFLKDTYIEFSFQ